MPRKKDDPIPQEIIAMTDEELQKKAMDFSEDQEFEELVRRRDAAQEAVQNRLSFKYALQKEYLKRLTAKTLKVK